MKSWHYLTVAGILVAALTIGLFVYLTQNFGGSQVANGQETPHTDSSSASSGAASVDVIHPARGMNLEVEQPGSAHAYESVDLRPKVSGFLKNQYVDIGDRVTKGQVLAIIDVPELEKQLLHTKASLNRADASVNQMLARVDSAKADRDAAEAAVEQANSAYKSAQAWVRYRHLVYDRRTKLFLTRSIEEALVDEAREKYEASLETERSAKAAIATSNANLTASIAKIHLAEADVLGAKADVKVHQADVEKTQVLLDFATIRAPFDGVVTRRNFFEKDFIRSASEGAAQEPLLTVQRTDKFRVVVRVPDSCVRYLDKGDPAIVHIDALPGKEFVATVSRKPDSEDPNTRLMRVEIDLPNPAGEIKDGMYGNVKIVLDRFADKLSVPLTSVVTPRPGHRAVYTVAPDGRAHLTEVQLGKDNGTSVVVLSGLRADDRVVLNPPNGLHDGAAVDAHLVQPPKALAEAP